ncbi:MFS general substrate transporter [Pseudovirgaria hyperparasitica]|uniref:MFS general substrate transporter n=1 Tax=Pseudovirgaria hyperparasitica TaxID=470096 RepID=A0A6A6WED7_9PEZI|nr:MFS general substrate transporter [Pseudovirgaria hyperparasitica]KAF2759481.1 MFS general substrate transporter [Pseudovirgaria hyperparasitica]
MWGDREKAVEVSPDAEQYSKNEDNNPLDQDDQEDHDQPVVCPAHTTERKLVNRMDFRILPFLCIMYLLAFLDRINISNANVFGLSTDLRLVNTEYNTALVIFFVPYILFEIPSNIILKKLKPHVWLSICMFGFGLVTLLQGFVQSYAGLLATRFFLGVFEAGMFPGSFYLIGMWYRRHEAQRRYSFFFSSTSLAGAFGGLLAAAIGKMSGVRGYAGWRWIFILEGLLTLLVSLFFFFLLPDFPEEARWLTDEERAYVIARLRVDQGKSARDRSLGARDILNVFRDYKILVGGLMYFGLIVPAYGYAYFSPAIIQSYGYSRIQTQLHGVPPWACAFGLAMIIAYISDKLRHRFLCAIVPICVCMSGFAILISVHNNRDVQYAALFLVAMGAYSAMPIIVCWFNMNLGGHHRRAVGSAWQVGFGNIAGIIAVFAFLPRDAPSGYHTGHSISISFVCLSALACTIYFVSCWWQNRLKDRSAVDRGLTEYEKTEMGDLSPDYRYLL